MKTYLPPQIPNPKQRAETRARLWSWVFWTVAILPLLVMLIAFGYSDQAPVWLRNFTAALDAAFGAPVWTLIKMAIGR